MPTQIQSLERLSVWRTEQAQPIPSSETPVPAGDTVSLSAEAEAALADDRGGEAGADRTAEADRGAGIYTARGRDASSEAAERPEAADEEQPATPVADPTELTERQQAEVEELKARDAEVRQHEQAHAARGGSFTSSPEYKYETGPDGRRYIVDGSVSIDVAKVDGDVKATLRKMETVIGAANAPANPSAQDRAVARAARTLALEARAELTAQVVDGEDTQTDEALEVTETRPVEESEASAAAASPLRPRIEDSLRAYRANAGPSG